MKQTILVFIALLSAQALASPAVIYSCTGKDSLSGQAITFDLTFSEWAPEIGYSNESVTVLRQGWETLANPIVLQMFDGNDQNACSRNEVGEIYMSSEHFKMEPTAQGDIADYKVSFKSDCADAKFNLEAYCFHQY